jgi:hypothetical protein
MSMTPETAQQVAEYVQEADSLISDFQQKNAALTAEIQQLKQTQKTASIAQSVFDKEAAEATVDHMVNRGLLKPSERAQTVTQLMDHPESALGYIDKMASATQIQKTASTLGQGFDDGPTTPAAGAERASDAHWDQTFGALHSKLR